MRSVGPAEKRQGSHLTLGRLFYQVEFATNPLTQLGGNPQQTRWPSQYLTKVDSNV